MNTEESVVLWKIQIVFTTVNRNNIYIVVVSKNGKELFLRLTTKTCLVTNMNLVSL